MYYKRITKRKPVQYAEKQSTADWTCPDCGWFVGEQYIPRRHNQQKCNYCAKCGCAIDWSDADMRGEQDEMC